MCEAIAGNVPEWRGRPFTHGLAASVRQRVYQIAAGYEDQDDADTFRSGPQLKLALGRLPETGEDLASQPTLSQARLVAEASYEASSRGRARRVVYEAEAAEEEGANTRFVVTSVAATGRRDSTIGTPGGEAEGWIKNFKRASKADRLGCHRFFADQ